MLQRLVRTNVQVYDAVGLTERRHVSVLGCLRLADRSFTQGSSPRRIGAPTSCRLLSTASSQQRSDPTAKRPNRVCDPYGQKGKPLSHGEVQTLRSTIHEDWRIVSLKDPDMDTVVNENMGSSSTMPSTASTPISLTRDFWHADFLSGSRFLQCLAAVAQINAHFPSLHLERRIVNKNWCTVSTVTCHTTVLGGLATHDFHLAMVRLFVEDSAFVRRYSTWTTRAALVHIMSR
jgi:pterin-4a-carbinolamine dehydratase